MQKQFVTYPIALKLKELGFDEPCLGFYDTHLNLQLGHKPEYLINIEKGNYIFGNDKIKILLAPLYQQVIDWFREKYNIMIHVKGLPSTQYMFSVYKEVYDNEPRICGNNFYKAREQAILKCIELCQKEKQFNTNKP